MAWQQGADAVEIDVQVSQDGRLVAIHDPTTDRTTGHPGQVSQQSLSDLQRLDAGAWKHPRFAGTRILTFQELLEAIPSGKRLFLELKCGPVGLPDLKRTLSVVNVKEERVVIIAFSLSLLRQTRQTLPQIPAYWIRDIRNSRPATRQLLSHRLIHLANRAGVQGLDLSACEPLDKAFSESIRNAGLHLGVWTVDEPSMARRMFNAGIDSLTTNRPGLIREHLENDVV